MKIVVFDLDETLGYFTQFGIFWDCLRNFLHSKTSYKLTQNDFNETLDLFPEFLRPNIITILQYLKHKKKTSCCHKLMIYTNNTGSKEWINHIKTYFETKINYPLVDQVIAAFKVNGVRVEICRTRPDKNHEDFIRCTKLPVNADICFLDDTFFPGMTNDNIYYINLKPYFYNLKFEDMLKIYKNSNTGLLMLKENQNEFEESMLKEIKKYNYEYVKKNEQEYKIDKILGKHILTHLQTFFNDKNKTKTRKNYVNRKNNTRKK
jgi:hypothetical protein